MPNLVLSRKAGQSVRLAIGEALFVYVDVLQVTGGYCSLRLVCGGLDRAEKVRFKGTLQVVEGIAITVLDLSKSYAKLGFEAPASVKILRTELIKEAV